MSQQVTVFLALSALAALAWALLRSRWYREAMGDLEGMRNAPEARTRPSGLHSANPVSQVMAEEGRRRHD